MTDQEETLQPTHVIRGQIDPDYDPPSASLNPRAITVAVHPHDLVGKARIRVFSGALGHEDYVMAEGDVIGYCDVPTLLLRHDDGSLSSWNVTLRREVVGPFGSTPDVPPPTPDEREQAAYARGVAEGRRQATEGWEREWRVDLGGGWPEHPCDSEADARRVAASREGRTVVSRLVGPWEADEQAVNAQQPATRCRCPFCCSTDDGRRIEVHDGVYARHLTGAGGECSGSGKSLAELPPLVATKALIPAEQAGGDR